MMKYLANAFSLSMLPRGDGPLLLTVYPLHDAAHAALELTDEGMEDWASCVGHADTAALFSKLLDLPVLRNRLALYVEKGDSIIVGQYSGQRLPEGATELPEGARIDWWEVVFEDVFAEEVIVEVQE